MLVVAQEFVGRSVVEYRQTGNLRLNADNRLLYGFGGRTLVSVILYGRSSHGLEPPTGTIEPFLDGTMYGFIGVLSRQRGEFTDETISARMINGQRHSSKMACFNYGTRERTVCFWTHGHRERSLPCAYEVL